MFSSRVSVEPQYGQRKAFELSWTSVVAPAERGAGGAKPASRSFSRPAGVMRSVDHESSRRTSTCASQPAASVTTVSSPLGTRRRRAAHHRHLLPERRELVEEAALHGLGALRL